jgi:hypothetical protein
VWCEPEVCGSLGTARVTAELKVGVVMVGGLMCLMTRPANLHKVALVIYRLLVQASTQDFILPLHV